MKEVLRVANCSGYYGDRLSAAKEMVDGGPIDVLTGDYLAELTMAILYGQRMARGETKGYVGTFLKQLKAVVATSIEKNIKIVSNAGGLNPKGMADEVEKILVEAGVKAKVAYIDGDDLMPDIEKIQAEGEELANMEQGTALKDSSNPPVTANVYFGAWAIKEALDRGADIVIAPRVTDAAVIIGPAAWKFNWQRNDYDALAGALAAGHIIECGAQCTGGNYSFFEEVESFSNVGYPIAEIEADGSFTITKHPGTGGLVSVGTVTEQLLYEISTPHYLNPDVIGHFDTLRVVQEGKDRVRVTNCKGSSPPSTHKVCINCAGPFKRAMEILLTGLDIEKKARVYLDAVFENLGGKEQFEDVDIQLIRSDKENPGTNEEAHAALRINVTSRDQAKVGRMFYAKVVELGLANIPGNAGRPAGAEGTRTIIYWPALIDSQRVTETLHMDGVVTEVLPTQRLDLTPVQYQPEPVTINKAPGGKTVRIPLGRLYGARSGDKGGCANLGVYGRSDEAMAFLYEYLTVEQLKVLMPDMAKYKIERYEMPNLKALNFYIHDVLGQGVSSNNRIDKQAKSMGEYLRAKYIDAPEVLVESLN